MKRDFTYIDDIIRGTRAALDNNYNCEIFNLGNNNSVDLMRMIGLIEKEIGKKAEIDFQPMQPGDAKESFADIDLTEKVLGFKSTMSINEGIPKFIDWYMAYHK